MSHALCLNFRRQSQQFYQSQEIMNRTKPYVNRLVKLKEQQIEDTYHSTNLKEIKPMTSKLMEHSQTIIINHGKRQMIKEVRQIQIERENKLLLQKIASVMGKKGGYSLAKNKNIRTKVNKSLNEIYRKRQLQNIELENKRFLIRLQNKRPTLNLQKLNKEWVQNKSTIKRMANVDFHLTNIKSTSRMRSVTTERFYKSKYDKMRLVKVKTVDGKKLLIKIEFVGDILKIVGDSQNSKDIKIIEIPKDEAVVFIQKECQGKFEQLVEKLKYDAQSETLYLVSDQLEEDDLSGFNPEMEKVASNKGKKNRKVQQDNRMNKSAVHNPSKVIKQTSKQSIDPDIQKSKTMNLAQPNKNREGEVKDLNKTSVVSPSIKKLPIDSHQHLQNGEIKNIEKQESVQQQDAKVQATKEGDHKVKTKQHEQPQVQEKNNTEIEQEEERKPEKEEQYAEQQFHQSRNKPEEEVAASAQILKAVQPHQKQIVLEAESPQDYKQSFQASAEVRKAEEVKKVEQVKESHNKQP